MAYRKGIYRGGDNSNSKLSEAEVRIILNELARGVSAASLARTYQVSAETIRRIGRGETWGWLRHQPATPPAGLEVTEITEEDRVKAAESFALLQLRMKGHG